MTLAAQKSSLARAGLALADDYVLTQLPAPGLAGTHWRLLVVEEAAVAVTKLACLIGMATEQAFLNALSRVTRYARPRDTLTPYHDDALFQTKR